MNTVRTIAKNAAALYVAQIVLIIQGVVLSILIARELGDFVFGEYSTAVSLAAIFAVFLSLGFPTVIVRDVARDKSLASRYLGNIALLKVILSLIIFGIIALTVDLLDYSRDKVIAVLILAVYNIFFSYVSLFHVIFRAFQQMEYVALTEIARSVLTLSLSIAAIFLGYGLIGIVCAVLIGGTFELILSYGICIRKFARPKFEIDLDLWKTVTKSALPIAFLGAAAIIYIRIDVVMLSSMKGDEVVGWYSAAYNLVINLKPVPMVFMQAVFPNIAIYYSQSQMDLLKVTSERSLRYLLMFGFPMATGMMLLADRIIPLMYGEQFDNSIIALRILAWDILLFFAGVVLANILVAMDRQKQMAIAAGSCAVLNVILNLILIPSFSYKGAGFATLATEAVLLVLYYYLVSKYLYRLPLLGILARQFVACLAMGAFIYGFHDINLVGLIVLGAVVYFAALYIVRGIDQDEISLLKRVVKFPRIN